MSDVYLLCKENLNQYGRYTVYTRCTTVHVILYNVQFLKKHEHFVLSSNQLTPSQLTDIKWQEWIRLNKRDWIKNETAMIKKFNLIIVKLWIANCHLIGPWQILSKFWQNYVESFRTRTTDVIDWFTVEWTESVNHIRWLGRLTNGFWYDLETV